MKVWRTILLIMFVLMVASMPLLAADEEWGSDMSNGEAENVENPFSTAFRFLQAVLISAATGALVGVRFMINIVKAYYSSDSQEGAYKREIVKFLITVAIVMFAGTTLAFVTGWVPSGS